MTGIRLLRMSRTWAVLFNIIFFFSSKTAAMNDTFTRVIILYYASIAKLGLPGFDLVLSTNFSSLSHDVDVEPLTKHQTSLRFIFCAWKEVSVSEKYSLARKTTSAVNFMEDRLYPLFIVRSRTLRLISVHRSHRNGNSFLSREPLFSGLFSLAFQRPLAIIASWPALCISFCRASPFLMILIRSISGFVNVSRASIPQRKFSKLLSKLHESRIAKRSGMYRIPFHLTFRPRQRINARVYVHQLQLV